MIQAFGYLRVSGPDQLDGDGFPRQSGRVQQFCEVKGWSLQACYLERAVSGRSDWSSRRALAELIAELSQAPKECRIIVVERPDRFAWDSLAAELALIECRKHGIQVWSADGATELTESNDPTTVFLRQTMIAAVQWQKTITVMQLRVARDRKKREGIGREGFEGVKPFGLKNGERAVLQQMLEIRRQGKSYATVARELNTRGYSKRNGSRWFASDIQKQVKRVQQ